MFFFIFVFNFVMVFSEIFENFYLLILIEIIEVYGFMFSVVRNFLLSLELDI